MKISSIVVVGFIATALAPALAHASPDLTRDNAALIQHIKATDPIFTKVLGLCASERIVRGKGRKFTYSGNCRIPAYEETDCQRYLVTAIGTVDIPTEATVRDIRLVLQCSA